jgi:hypothetical protein
MAYVKRKTTMNVQIVDSEARESSKTLTLDNAITNTTGIAQALNDTMFPQAAVKSYTFSQKYGWDAEIDLTAGGDIGDITNLVFLDQAQEKIVHSIPGTKQSCFMADEGEAARIVKPFATLDAAAAGTPEKALADYIGYIFSGEILISRLPIVAYSHGYKAD